jgi:hypothetical protein
MQDLNWWMGDMNKTEKAVAQAVSSNYLSCLNVGRVCGNILEHNIL